MYYRYMNRMKITKKRAGNGTNVKKRKHWLQEALYDEKSADEKSGDGEL